MKKKETSRIETHTLDHKRDILLTGWTSHLIANMVQTRKSLYESGKGIAVKLMFFDEKEWKRAQKANVKGQHFVINFDHKP